MKFIYHKEASKPNITLEKEIFKHIFQSRRHSIEKPLFLRNLQEHNIYEYQIEKIDKRKADLILINTKHTPQKQDTYLHIGWCIIDSKEIEKSLPILNELGVAKISFIYCDRSQRKYKINKDRLMKIIISSSEQCGRSDLMQIEEIENLLKFREKYNNAKMLHFSKENIKDTNIQTILIGAEGGWCDKEVSLYKDNIVGINQINTMKSSSIAIAIASKLLL